MIETERLIIRAPRAHERVHVHELFADLTNERVDPGADAAQIRRWAYGVPWGVWERETGELVGDCSLHYDTTFGDWELSYGFRRDRWGRGYATEAAAACRDWALGQLGLTRVISLIALENIASVRVAEKIGESFEREVDNTPFPHRYGLWSLGERMSE